MKPVQTKEEILQALISHKEEIKQFAIKRIGLFGSYVRGEQNQESDVDILVEFLPGQKNFKNFIQLAYYLEELLGRRVELVTSESLSPYLKPYILKEVEYVKAIP